jgi:hypothetical protein
VNAATLAVWLGRLALLALCVILCAALTAAQFGSSYLAAALGAAAGCAFWWVAVFGPPEWADGQR